VTVELLIDGAELVGTLDADDREIPGGWVALDRGLVAAVGGPTDERPVASRVLRADGCLVTPGVRAPDTSGDPAFARLRAEEASA
jgi:predicted amidohydrolase